MKNDVCKKTFVLLLFVCMCFGMTGCGSMDSGAKERIGALDNHSTDAGTPQTDENWIVAEASQDDKSLVINAPITAYPKDSVFRVTLVKDEDGLVALADELIISQYPDYQEDMWGWSASRDGKLVASLGSDNLWTTNYLDVRHDQDGLTLEEEQLFREFITDLIPEGSIHTAKSAMDIACEFINGHSDALEFQAYNVLATEDKKTGAGFYTVNLQACYKGIPVSRHHDITTRSVSGNVHVGNSGIFCVCAMFLLKEAEAENVAVIDAKQAANALCERFHLLLNMQDIQIDRVALEYFFLTNDDGSYTLRPVWRFMGSGQQQELNHRSNISVLYFADDGSFCGVYFDQ